MMSRLTSVLPKTHFELQEIEIKKEEESDDDESPDPVPKKRKKDEKALNRAFKDLEKIE